MIFLSNVQKFLRKFLVWNANISYDSLNQIKIVERYFTAFFLRDLVKVWFMIFEQYLTKPSTSFQFKPNPISLVLTTAWSMVIFFKANRATAITSRP